VLGEEVRVVWLLKVFIFLFNVVPLVCPLDPLLFINGMAYLAFYLSFGLNPSL